MELPNYRMPSPKSVLMLMWDKAKDFITKAFTVIFAATIIIWFLQSFDAKLNVVTDSADSMLAMIGQLISPLFKPLGFEDWRISTSLITGLTAKEAVVSTLGVLLSSSNAELSSKLSELFTQASALSFLVFTLLYTPCIAAVSTIRKELNSPLKTGAIVAAQCIIAWIMAFIVFNIVSLLI